MDAKTLELFRNMERDLCRICVEGSCDKCAFNCKGYCGTNILRSVMAKLDGARQIGLTQYHSDDDLYNFIVRNELKKKE